MIGASASISGFMAAAMRFAFQRAGPLGLLGRDEPSAYRVPALPLTAVLRDPRVLAFLGVWFALNLLFGLGSLSLDGGEQAIAWQAHIGGFLAGLLLLSRCSIRSGPCPRCDDGTRSGDDSLIAATALGRSCRSHRSGLTLRITAPGSGRYAFVGALVTSGATNVWRYGSSASKEAAHDSQSNLVAARAATSSPSRPPRA